MAHHIVTNDVIPDSIRDPASSFFSNRVAPAIFKAAGSRSSPG
ncbi:hypothetical protein HNP60_002838 [Sphingobium sp. B1D3A]|uniref:Uncharacterized protein n=1 Tax=Sphingobium lignivorans TaxID=2735886 RepID=A0ABR6NHV7_9SPHN|nr:hypothetical protein [Sphingobium lignivorans]